ncbi:hypothetical protein BDV25DRAFT_128539 [Aspergillus avenaceus]|uniref:Uncharacterized protein n=1 Tax=Aspergillus avenaceus TaxID=36643 RepID=A0A5N6TZC5_ASPAV|nr:hypothetical protein BDV25DRAFT_128539 [Aspergillus avenaceus]
MPSSIIRSFDEKLPRSPHVMFTFKDNYREFRSSVSSTVAANAVRVYIKEDISSLQGFAARYLDLRLRPFSPLSEIMPALERSHVLSTEADVVRLSTLQLLHPVNIALQEFAPSGTVVVCSSEKQGGQNSRFDIQWSLRSEDGRFLTTLAILEVKNTHVVHKTDFTPAERTSETYEAGMQEAMKFAPQYTLLEGNAVWLSKQASKYSGICTDVAVFDWNAMFIFNFNGRDSTGRKKW